MEHGLDLLNSLSVVELTSIQLNDFHLHMQVSGSTFKRVQNLSGFLICEVDNSTSNTVLTRVDRLIEQVKESLLSFLNAIVFSQIDPRHRDDLALDDFKSFLNIDADFFQRFEFIITLQFAHQFEDFPLFFVSSLDSALRDLLSSELIEVFGNASHQAKFRKEIGWRNSYIFVFALVLNSEERLLIILDGNIILLLVVFLETQFGIL